MKRRHTTRKQQFLQRMDALIPWSLFIDIIEPYYPKSGKGRRPYPLIHMLKIHFLQQWYSLSDEGMEDALYDIETFYSFVFGRNHSSIPDRTTIMNFRHLVLWYEGTYWSRCS